MSRRGTAETSPTVRGITWSDLLGHTRIVKSLAVALGKERLTGSLLLVGPPGVGKTTIAMLIAKTLLCERVSPTEMAPCQTCPGCRQVDARTHPDLIEVRKPDDKTLIPLELLIGPPEARLREGFCHEIHLRPMRGRRKVAVMHDADYLNEEGANCLLKTLEEPPRDALILLIGTSEQRQLPTIRSRCQILRLNTPPGADGAELLRRQCRVYADEQGIEPEPITATDDELLRTLELAAGDLHIARRLMIGQSGEFRQSLVNQLSQEPPDPATLIRLINGHLEAAGKETPVRREALRDACAIAIQHYRGQLRELSAANRCDPAVLHRLDRTVRVFRELDRMANLSTLVECFAADLTLATTGDRGGIG